MIQTLDKLWFLLLSALYLGVLRWARGHSRREKWRRFRRGLGWENNHLN